MAAPDNSTVTPGSAAPDESVMVPITPPDVAWPNIGAVAISNNASRSRTLCLIFPPIDLLRDHMGRSLYRFAILRQNYRQLSRKRQSQVAKAWLCRRYICRPANYLVFNAFGISQRPAAERTLQNSEYRVQFCGRDVKLRNR